MDHKRGQWATQILNARDSQGLWGNFHTLSRSASGKPYTTEQALRRLVILGYRAEDREIQPILRRMIRCIRGEEKIDGYFEKKHDWPLFEKLMLSAWIRILDPWQPDALEFAGQWARVAEAAFSSGEYDLEREQAAFSGWQGRKPKSSGFETGFGMFYHAALLQDALPPKVERPFLDYILSRPQGMYYIYGKPLNQPPAVFASRESSSYLAALEVLAGYSCAGEKLAFAAEWLLANREADGQWDFGHKAKDGVHFPLSDSWRRLEDRKRDCTERVDAFLRRIRRRAEA